MRWRILAALTFARLSMGFQFQSIPALALPLSEAQDLSFAAIGTLTGAYLLPGAVIALAGGWLGRRIGDARIAVFGLALMTVAGLAGWWTRDFEAAVFWRLLAGVGAVGLNVMVTKMAADWFDGRPDLPAAMGVLVSSWPAGLALATLSLPLLAQNHALEAVLLVPVCLCAAGWALLATVWRAPDRPPAQAAQDHSRFVGRELILVVLAGVVWGIYNVAYVAVIAWGPGVLQQAGVAEVDASAAVSIAGWFSILSVAAGGFILSRIAWKTGLALLSFLVSALLVAVLPAFGQAASGLWLMAVLGVFLGLPAAFVMTLPVAAARPQVRAMTMGIYFAIYYAVMGLAPGLLGALRDTSGNAAAPVWTAAGLLVFSLVATVLFRTIAARTRT